jgi:hypothetical protein
MPEILESLGKHGASGLSWRCLSGSEIREVARAVWRSIHLSGDPRQQSVSGVADVVITETRRGAAGVNQ